MVNKFHKGDIKARKLVLNVYEKYYEFYKKFIEFATGMSFEYYSSKYFVGVLDATKEELHELTGIFIAFDGNQEVYCIPRDVNNDKFFDYIINNVPCKFKILKRTAGGTYMDHGPTTWRRDMSNISDEKLKNLKNKKA